MERRDSSTEPRQPGNAKPGSFSHHHRDMLLISLAVMVLAAVLAVRSDERVVLPFLPDHPLPPACMSKVLFNVSCPGCGLTRSFICLAHGEWQAAFRMHRLGWLLALAVVAQIPYRIAAIRLRADRPLGSLVPRLFGYALIVLLLGNWVLQRFGM